MSSPLRRTPDGYVTADGRFQVVYLSCQDLTSCPWTWAWCAVDTATGRKVPCASQRLAREQVFDWLRITAPNLPQESAP